jgi:hypothetical protein
MKKKLLIGVGLGLLALNGSVLAQDQGRSLTESIEKVQTKAQRLDANGDGWLTPDETAKGRKTLGFLYDKVEARVDLNGDGQISVNEYVESQVDALRRADLNSDGWISEDEGRAQKRRLIGELIRQP